VSSLTLTMDGYFAMSSEQRDEFHAWLEANGLKGSMIFEARFGEGHLEANCYSLNERGQPFIATRHPVPMAATEQRTIRLRTPPPSFVFGYCA
jgi:hypothetical protein